jgi:glycerophosphoryl diester phosphodiesterase
LPAFVRAVELGTDAIETDLRPTREGAVVLIHDATLDRTTNGRGRVADFTLAELAQLDAGGGARIPTLEEFLLWARSHGLELFLELKTRGSPRSGWIDAAVGAVEGERLLERATFLCFDADVLARIKLIQPQARTGWLRSRRLWNPWPRLAAEGAAVFAPEWKLVNAQLVERAHRSGLRVVTWTVDEPLRMRRLMALGVDGLATNYPERLNQALAADARGQTPWR